MLSATSLKKLSQITASAVVGIAAVGAMTIAPVSAANIKQFNLFGNFAPNPVTGSTGLSALLGGGSFSGTYAVDVDKLPDDGSGVYLENWNVNLFDSSNTLVKSFTGTSNPVSPNKLAFVETNALRFAEFSSIPPSVSILSVIFPQGFTGTGHIKGGFYDNFSGANLGSIAIASGKSEPVPEPFTIAGTAVAGAMGLWMKRKQQKASATE